MTPLERASHSYPTEELQHELSINCSGDASTVRLSSRGRLHHEQSINWNEQSFLLASKPCRRPLIRTITPDASAALESC